VALTTHLHLVPSLKMSQLSVHPLPLYAFMVRTETLPLPLGLR
jgi:hypothetical protein